jgi:hypothetical protein
MWYVFLRNWVSLSVNPKWINGFGKSMRILMVKLTSINLPLCTNAVFLIKLVSNRVTFITLCNFWCLTWPAVARLLLKILSNWFMSATQIQICYKSISFKFSEKGKRLKMDNKDKFSTNNTWSRCEKMIWKGGKSFRRKERLSRKWLAKNKKID